MYIESTQLISIRDKQFEMFIPEEQILARVDEIATEINLAYAELRPLLIVVLNGAFLFAADLVRRLTVQPEVQFIRISTYGDQMISSETAQILLGMEIEVEDRDVIIVEDIVDTGYTTDFFREHLSQQSPKSVRLASLLFKPDNYRGTQAPDFIGFSIAPDFVVGYGMDYAQQGRELRGIYRLSAN
ncbi:MAG: hypoxanthine phosphoribosyltransferase [Bacteroidetes bacterium]|nr:MAG: hypoxanthine phosphoribosyltransferase [Bacteroidota bacterium]